MHGFIEHSPASNHAANCMPQHSIAPPSDRRPFWDSLRLRATDFFTYSSCIPNAGVLTRVRVRGLVITVTTLRDLTSRRKRMPRRWEVFNVGGEACFFSSYVTGEGRSLPAGYRIIKSIWLIRITLPRFRRVVSPRNLSSPIFVVDNIRRLLDNL